MSAFRLWTPSNSGASPAAKDFHFLERFGGLSLLVMGQQLSVEMI